MLYFAYGSNMSVKRLTKRAPSARKLSVGMLRRHKLAFRKIGDIDGSAKCDIAPSESENAIVFGVIFEIADDQIDELDRVEGLGHGYDSRIVELNDTVGERISAKTYYATSIDASLKPYHWYKNHVIVGAKENDLPDFYIKSIEIVESIDDPCADRANSEVAMYR